jgi:hypothetical protein
MSSGIGIGPTLLTATNNLGGPFRGYSGKQSISNYKDSSSVITRRELRKVWNGNAAIGNMNGFNRRVTPFRAVMNSGDFLSRTNYICGGPAPVNNTRASAARQLGLGGIISACDSTNIPSASCNVKFVSASSDYTKFRRQRACNQNYNDLKFGGYNNSAYVPALAAVHGGANVAPR